MLRKIISILLPVIFLTLLAEPLIATFIDDSVDVKAFSSLGEEEQEIEKNQNFETLLFENKPINASLTFLAVNNNLVYFLKDYSKPNLNLIFPPPKT